MTAPGVLPDRAVDPAGFLLAAADRVEQDAAAIVGESPRLSAFVLAQVALWRGIAGRHWGKRTVAMPPHPDGPIYCCATCMTDVWPCPDLLAAVEAAAAYLGGQ